MKDREEQLHPCALTHAPRLGHILPDLFGFVVVVINCL